MPFEILFGELKPMSRERYWHTLMWSLHDAQRGGSVDSDEGTVYRRFMAKVPKAYRNHDWAKHNCGMRFPWEED